MPIKLPLEQHIEDFRNKGVVLLPGALDQPRIDALRNSIERNLNAPGPLTRNYPSEGVEGRFHSDLFLWRQDPVLRSLVVESDLPACAAKLLGATKINLFYDQVFVKEPRTRNKTPWHQDLPYWPLKGVHVLSFWIALDQVSLSSGALEYVEGSHHWPHRYQPFSFAGPNTYERNEELELMPDLESMRDRLSIVSFDMAPGDALAFDARILHGAGGNSCSDVRRRGYAIRYCGDDVTYEPRTGTLSLPCDPGLSAGAPLDSELFPRVWERS